VIAKKIAIMNANVTKTAIMNANVKLFVFAKKIAMIATTATIARKTK
jgi:hypothetical protein